MLIISIIRASFNFIGWVISAFPTANIVMPWLSNVRDFWSVCLQVDAALPMHEIVDAAAVYMTFVIVLQGGAIVKKLWSVIPVIGGGV